MATRISRRMLLTAPIVLFAACSGSESKPPACRSNTECAAPASLCDTTRGVCVECLVYSDCGYAPGTVCSLGTCVCPSATDTWCGPSDCVDLASSAASCGACGHACYGDCAGGVCADPWEPVAPEGAPDARANHVAVWTGSEMFVWGGDSGDCDACTLATGGLYDPATYQWRPTSPVGAPSPRRRATAVWTGTEVLVWGGYSGGTFLGTGARFDPRANHWQPMSTTNAPSPRYAHTAVWTGTEMIVWGGTDGVDRFATGGRYRPDLDTWTPTAMTTPGRSDHSAVWTGDAMLVYGGQGEDMNIPDPNAYLPTASVVGGATYNPVANSWSPLLTQGQPSSRAGHPAVALGDAMLVWGGYNGSTFLSTGASYSTSGWVATLAPEPEGRRFHTAVAVGDPAKALVWGGEGAAGELATGGVYDPETNAWTTLPTAPSPRRLHTAVSTGTAMIIWGGVHGSTRLGDGAVYTP